jgi:AbrB family looped-hinge helix DNA binding protein
MPTAKMTSKGQVTIPKEVRVNLRLRPGDEVDFVRDGSGFQLKKRMTATALVGTVAICGGWPDMTQTKWSKR